MILPSAPIAFVGERKAIAQLCLVFYAAFFALMALLTANAPPDMPELRAWWPCWTALSALYGASFFSLAAGWFWARWFAVGLGYSGLTMAFWGLVMQRSVEPVLVFYGITHGLVTLLLQGSKMAEEFDGKPAWRERFKLDEAGVARVRNSVTRAATSLPTLIMFILAPREAAGALLLLALTGLGLFGLLRLRTYGVLLLGLSGAGTLGLALSRLGHDRLHLAMGSTDTVVHVLGLTAGALLLTAALPFTRPLLRFLRSR